jgi:hypothetical protein
MSFKAKAKRQTKQPKDIVNIPKDFKASESQENDLSRTAQNKARFLEAYRASGTIYVATLNSGLSRATIYRWQDDDRNFKAAMRQCELELVEHLESKAVSIAKGGDGNMIQWLLKCLHRDKYSDRIRHEFETKTMDLVISEIVLILQKRVPQFCPHCRTGLDISPLIAQDLLAMSSALVAKKEQSQ